MTPPAAVSSCLRQYVGFRGRASRSEYWWFVAFTGLVAGICGAIDHRAGVNLLGPLINVALFLPSVAVAVRRLHDTNHAGWWYLGFVLVVPFVWIFFRGTQGRNRFGPDPLGGVDVVAVAPRPAIAGRDASDPAPAGQAIADRALRRLVATGRGVSVPMPATNDEVTFDLGVHEGSQRGYAVFTRDAEGVALQLDFDVPSIGDPDLDLVVSRLSREFAVQAYKRLPRMTATKAEDVWARLERVRAQPRPVGASQPLPASR